jgi:hypothetical protein
LLFPAYRYIQDYQIIKAFIRPASAIPAAFSEVKTMAAMRVKEAFPGCDTRLIDYICGQAARNQDGGPCELAYWKHVRDAAKTGKS